MEGRTAGARRGKGVAMNERARRYQPSSMRASDADRDAVLSELSEHFQAGRLTSDEFDERSSGALQAKTFGDLAGLMTDLPPVGPASQPATPAPVPAGPPRQAGPRPAVAVVAGLVLVVLVVSVAFNAGAGFHSWHLFWPVLVVPLVLRGLAARQHRR